MAVERTGSEPEPLNFENQVENNPSMRPGICKAGNHYLNKTYSRRKEDGCATTLIAPEL